MYPQATIYGIDTNEIHLQEAIALGVIDAAGSMIICTLTLLLYQSQLMVTCCVATSTRFDW
jgi:hypothetical protein